jgi:hypothetical protein
MISNGDGGPAGNRTLHQGKCALTVFQPLAGTGEALNT